jgi:hypothetical protein
LKPSSSATGAPYRRCKQSPIRRSIISLFVADFGWTGAAAGS